MLAASLPSISILAIGSAQLFEILIGAIGFVAAFGLAVFIHEMGHFLAAKMFGVPVERFVIGMDKEAMGFLPRCIWERRIGETTYGLSLIPLGGYVKMSGVVHPDIERYLEGESKPEVVPDDAPRAPQPADKSLKAGAMQDMAALYRKPFWQKTIIYGAGVFMNMVLATLFMTAMFTIGFKTSAPDEAIVGWVAPDSVFAGKLATGDRLLSVNGVPVQTWEDIYKAMEAANGGKPLKEYGPLPLNLELARGGDPAGERYSLTATVAGAPGEKPDKESSDFFAAVPRRHAYVEMVIPNSPAAKGGLLRGDTIVAIDGEPIEDWTEFTTIVRASPNKKLEFAVLRKEERVVLGVTPWADAEDRSIGQVGIQPGSPKKQLEQEPFLTALVAAPARVYNHTVNYVSRLTQLGGHAVRGNVAVVSRELSGPAGIAQIAYKMSNMGFTDWMHFVIVLNVALAVMNILPFPVLDGGHICFAIYEAIFRRPVPPRVLVPLLNGAVVFILFFFVLVTFNDIRKIFF